MIVFLAMSVLEILIGTMSISRYGVMTVYRVIIMDLMSDIVWLIVLDSTISQTVLLMRSFLLFTIIPVHHHDAPG